MDELSLGITGENMHYGTPTNPERPSCIPGGSSGGSAVAVSAGLVDFAIGIDTIGCVRIPASFCGILGFRSSHGAVCNTGSLSNSKSLDAVGWFARDPSVLHCVGQLLLKLNSVKPGSARRIIFCNDLLQLSIVPAQKTADVIKKAIEKLAGHGYESPKYMNLCKYIASNVPSLKEFHDLQPSTQQKNGASILKTLSSIMISLQGFEFKTNYEQWIVSVKPRVRPDVSNRVAAAVPTNLENLFKVKTEMEVTFQSLLKVVKACS